MIKFLIILVSTLPLGNIYAQLSNSQNLTSPYGQTAFSIPKGSALFQNVLVIGNQIHYGIGKSTSIGLSMFPTSLNSDQLQIVGALSPNYAIGINSRESFKIGAFVSFGFAPKTGGLTDLVGLYLLYSRCLSRNDMITIGYSYMGSTTNFPPWSNLINVNYKHSIINSKVGLEIDGIYRWSEENWGMPEWGTIWNDKHLLFTAIVSLRFKQNDHIALGLTNSYHHSWTPILGASENSLLFPFLGYSCLIGAD